jgi:hypothetical protein
MRFHLSPMRPPARWGRRLDHSPRRLSRRRVASGPESGAISGRAARSPMRSVPILSPSRSPLQRIGRPSRSPAGSSHKRHLVVVKRRLDRLGLVASERYQHLQDGDPGPAAETLARDEATNPQPLPRRTPTADPTAARTMPTNRNPNPSCPHRHRTPADSVHEGTMISQHRPTHVTDPPVAGVLSRPSGSAAHSHR